VLCLRAAPSPRLERCIAAAKEAGAPEEWLQEKYASIRKGSTYGHQAFRILCFAGPGELSKNRVIWCGEYRSAVKVSTSTFTPHSVPPQKRCCAMVLIRGSCIPRLVAFWSMIRLPESRF
jgi:hypothetical protein